MPSFAEMRQFLGGQIFEIPRLPTTDLSNKVMIVTGANTGVGYECAKHLAKLNASILILACRNVQKGEKARRTILDETRCRTSVRVWQCDLDDFKSVTSFGDRVRTELPRLDGFVANAGVELKDFELSEGFERTLTINVISTFLLALLALPKLKETSITHNTSAHLTIVGSMIHIFGPDAQLQVPLGTNLFQALSESKTADMRGRYFLSKLMVHQCVHELAHHVSATMKDEKHQVVVNNVNPGWCRTELQRYHNGGGLIPRILIRIIGRDAESGSRTMVHAVTAEKDTHGHYLSECRGKPESHFVESAEGQRVQKRVWEDLLTKIDGISPGASDVISS